jgi:hypothetical protein
MELAAAAFTLGAVLILVGLVGGDLTWRGLQIPKVGRMPRFSTTVVGTAFLLIGLFIWLVEVPVEALGDPTASGTPTNVPTATGPPADGPTATGTPNDVEYVTVTFYDALTEGAVTETIEVTVDGQAVGSLSADVYQPSASLPFGIEPATHTFELSGVVVLADMSELELMGKGDFQADAGSAFDLVIAETGELGLSRSA